MIATLRSELIKVRHSRVLRAVLAITLALSLGITVLVILFGDTEALAERQTVEGGGKYERSCSSAARSASGRTCSSPPGSPRRSSGTA